jgi:hypothetical protein
MYRDLFLFAIAFFAALPLASQQAEPITYVALYKVRPGRENDFVNFVKTNIQPVLEKHISEGDVLEWGLDVVELHHVGEATHTLWYTMPSYAALDKVVATREESIKATPKAVLHSFAEMTDPERRHDFVFRPISRNFKPAPAGTLPWLVVTKFRVQPGTEDDVTDCWEKYDKPIWEKLLADGTVMSYALLAEDLISAEPEWRWFVARVRDSAAIGKIHSAFHADREQRSVEERTAIQRQSRVDVVPGTAHDDLLHAVIYVMK